MMRPGAVVVSCAVPVTNLAELYLRICESAANGQEEDALEVLRTVINWLDVENAVNDEMDRIEGIERED